jgi:hypothetical protein
MNRAGIEPPNPTCIFFAACLWREKNRSPVPLPFWSAPEVYHYRLSLHVGLRWMADFLECVAAAAHTGLAELERLRRAEEKSAAIPRTNRSRLKDAITAAIRGPIITTRDLADTLHITPQAALGLLRQLSEAGVIQEATGRASWRVFCLT